MTDKELLELAAKAAGIEGEWVKREDYVRGRWYFHVPYDSQGLLAGFEWNPLREDGDALHLAVELGINVVQHYHRKEVAACCDIGEYVSVVENYNDDPFAATRRAIVRAAAEIERAKG